MMSGQHHALKIVRAVGEINFVGNITPHSWYTHLKLKNGKPYVVAITVLSELVYWYRPIVVKDEQTGRITIRKKFSGDKYRASYGELAERFGFSKEQVEAACTYLREQGLIATERRDRDWINGVLKGNVLYFEVCPEKLREISALPDEEALEETPYGSGDPYPMGVDLPRVGNSTPLPYGSGFAYPRGVDLPSLRGTKTPTETPAQIPTKTPPQTPAALALAAESGGEGEDRDLGSGDAIDQQTREFLKAHGVRALGINQSLPFRHVDEATRDVRDNPQLIAFRCKQIREGICTCRLCQRPDPVTASAPGDPGPIDPQVHPLAALWQQVLSALQAQLPALDVATWLTETALVDMTERVAIVGTPNLFVRDHVRQHYADQIRGALSQLGRPVDVQIEIGGLS